MEGDTHTGGLAQALPVYLDHLDFVGVELRATYVQTWSSSLTSWCSTDSEV